MAVLLADFACMRKLLSSVVRELGVGFARMSQPSPRLARLLSLPKKKQGSWTTEF